MKNKIIAHRGIWNNNVSGNSYEALTKALDSGYGIEFDIRDLDGELVVAHDPPRTKYEPLLLEKLFEYYIQNKCSNILAINIKSDEIHEVLKLLIDKYEIKNYFIFDLSIPHLIKANSIGLSCLRRESEYEEPNTKIESITKGRWIDYFSKSHMNKIKVSSNKEVFNIVVSPELHGFTCTHIENKIHLALVNNENYWVCTDNPERYNR